MTPARLSLLKREGIEAGKALERTAGVLLAAGTEPEALLAAFSAHVEHCLEVLPYTNRRTYILGMIERLRGHL